MMIIKLWPCPHVEVRVHVSEEMIEDLRICREILEEESREQVTEQFYMSGTFEKLADVDLI